MCSSSTFIFLRSFSSIEPVDFSAQNVSSNCVKLSFCKYFEPTLFSRIIYVSRMLLNNSCRNFKIIEKNCKTAKFIEAGLYSRTVFWSVRALISSEYVWNLTFLSFSRFVKTIKLLWSIFVLLIRRAGLSKKIRRFATRRETILRIFWITKIRYVCPRISKGWVSTNFQIYW